MMVIDCVLINFNKNLQQLVLVCCSLAWVINPLGFAEHPEQLNEDLHYFSLNFFVSNSSLMTSSCSSDDIDQEEIQLALQAAKIATREKIRSRFHGSNDLIHRLFVCISGMRVSFCSECKNYSSILVQIKLW